MAAAQIVSAVMDEWKAGIDSRDPGRVAAVFTDDAVFQGLRPYGVGRAAVVAYYASQPAGMTVDYRVLESRRLTDRSATGYLSATFGYPDRADVVLAIGVTLVLQGGHWLISQYQASPSAPPRMATD